MESKDKLNETDIKNSTCYYFDERIRFWDRDIDFSDGFLQRKIQIYFNLWHFRQNFNG